MFASVVLGQGCCGVATVVGGSGSLAVAAVVLGRELSSSSCRALMISELEKLINDGILLPCLPWDWGAGMP